MDVFVLNHPYGPGYGGGGVVPGYGAGVAPGYGIGLVPGYGGGLYGGAPLLSTPYYGNQNYGAYQNCIPAAASYAAYAYGMYAGCLPYSYAYNLGGYPLSNSSYLYNGGYLYPFGTGPYMYPFTPY